MTVPLEITLPLVVTEEGLDAAVNANSFGLDLVLTHLAVGDGTAQHTTASTELHNERERVEIMSWRKPEPRVIDVSALVISSSPEWVAREIGVYAGDVLVAAGTRAGGLVTISNGIPYAISASLSLVALPAETSISVNAVLLLELPFIDPLVAMGRVMLQLTRARADHAIQLRALRGKQTAGITGFGT